MGGLFCPYSFFIPNKFLFQGTQVSHFLCFPWRRQNGEEEEEEEEKGETATTQKDDAHLLHFRWVHELRRVLLKQQTVDAEGVVGPAPVGVAQYLSQT